MQGILLRFCGKWLILLVVVLPIQIPVVLLLCENKLTSVKSLALRASLIHLPGELQSMYPLLEVLGRVKPAAISKSKVTSKKEITLCLVSLLA